MKNFLIGSSFVLCMCIATELSFDYFGNGCMVDYDHVYVTQIRPGEYISENGVTCHQTIIHTARGKFLEGTHK